MSNKCCKNCKHREKYTDHCSLLDRDILLTDYCSLSEFEERDDVPFRKAKYGEWIKHEDKLGMIDDLMCSLCGHCTYEDYPNFCSNCGADMRGGEKNG